jgi:DNA repair protein RecO (recombination protein O)
MSATQRVLLEPTFVLHHRPYRDTSLLLDVFTSEHGRVGLVARGARRASSPLRGTLQPFAPLLLSWSGRGELCTLTGAERGAVGPVPAGRALLCGLYVNELVMRFTHRNEPHRVLFAHYAATLAELGGSMDEQQVLRRFEKTLLEEVGFGLILDHDVERGEPVTADLSYAYVPERGPVRCTSPMDGVPIVRGATLIALDTGTGLEAGQSHEAKRLMRAVIEHHLAGRPLVSRTLFRAGGGRAGKREVPMAAEEPAHYGDDDPPERSA